MNSKMTARRPLLLVTLAWLGSAACSETPDLDQGPDLNQGNVVQALSGTFQIAFAHSAKCLGVEGGSGADRANVRQESCSTATSQQWEVTDLGNGYHTLKAAHSGKCMDVSGGVTATGNGANIHQWTCHGKDNQQFRLVSKGSGQYQLQAKHSGKCADVEGASTADGANVLQWSCHDGNNQRVVFKTTGGGSGGTGVGIPARIQAQNYVRYYDADLGNNGGACREDDVDLQSTSDSGGVCNIGWIRPGEWVEYDIHASAGAYDIVLRVASAYSGRNGHVEIDGKNVGSFTAPSNGWQAFSDRRISGVNIGSGNHKVRVVFDSGSINFNYLEFESGSGSTPAPAPGGPDPDCSTGIANGEVCCAASCGTCGGSGCSGRPGGASSCCGGSISNSGRYCSETEPPCILTDGGSPTPDPDPGLTWRQANLTWFTSYPDPGSEECIKYNGCTWAGYFAALNGKQSEEWVRTHNIAAVHSKDFATYRLKTLRLRKGSDQIDVVVYDMCADTDCSGCCTQNSSSTGFLIDLESYTAARFGHNSGTVEWTCLDCN